MFSRDAQGPVLFVNETLILIDKLSVQPNDWDYRRVLADYFEEQSCPLYQECMLWTAKHRKRPYCLGTGFAASWFLKSAIDAMPDKRGDDPESDLPDLLWIAASTYGTQLLVNPEFQFYVRTWTSRKMAELALLQGWALLSSQDRPEIDRILTQEEVDVCEKT